MNQTAITYPSVTVNELTGAQIKDILEDVCDNLFNPDPYYQQGGDMVSMMNIGSLSSRTPKETFTNFGQGWSSNSSDSKGLNGV